MHRRSRVVPLAALSILGLVGPAAAVEMAVARVDLAAGPSLSAAAAPAATALPALLTAPSFALSAAAAPLSAASAAPAPALEPALSAAAALPAPAAPAEIAAAAPAASASAPTYAADARPDARDTPALAELKRTLGLLRDGAELTAATPDGAAPRPGVTSAALTKGRSGGYLGVRIAKPELAEPLPEGTPDRGEFHVTLIAPPEWQALSEADRARLSGGADIPGAPVAARRVDMTVGGERVHVLLVDWPQAQQFRAALGLAPKSFHVSLSGNVTGALAARVEKALDALRAGLTSLFDDEARN